VRPAVAAGTQQAVRGQNVPVHDMCGVHLICVIVQSMRRYHVAFDPKRTWAVAPQMSAFGGRVDVFNIAGTVGRRED